MTEQIFIPDKLKVGYQERSDTYTKKLAYVTYFDNKGKLRKEGSWEGWRDEKIKPEEFENKPIEGFVINRNGGGARASYGWNVRHEFVRVFDPRGFEFEISIANLLYILQESNSIKGKGLEGEFVYGWVGTSLCLLPVNSPEFLKCKSYTSLQSGKVSAKSLVPGLLYQTKKQQKLVYIAKHVWYETKTKPDETNSRGYITVLNATEKYIFSSSEEKYVPVVMSGLSSLAAKLTEHPLENTATLLEEFAKDVHISKATGKIIIESATVKLDAEKSLRYVNSNTVYKQKSEFIFEEYAFQKQITYDHEKSRYVHLGFTAYPCRRISIRGDIAASEYLAYPSNSIFGKKVPVLSQEEIESEPYVNVLVELESGALIPLKTFLSR